MKALDVSDLQNGIDEVQSKIDIHKERLTQIEAAVTGIVSLSDSLKGEGGAAIRRFYQQGHLPFLQYLKLSLTQYSETLSQMKAALQAFEPASNGRIQESFLEQDVDQGLRKVELVTANITNETNATMQKVSDIVALPPLRDDEVRQSILQARQEKDQTLEQLHRFDYEQAAALDTVEADVTLMGRYVQDIQAMFQGQGIRISSITMNQLTYQQSSIMLKSNLSQKQTQTTHLLKQMQPAASGINASMTAVAFDKWTNPSCARPDHVNKAIAAEPERKWWQKAGDQIVDGAKTVGRVAKEHSRELGSAAIDFTPFLGNVKAGVEASSGVDPITKRELEDWEQALAAAAILGGGIVKFGSRTAKGVQSVGGKGRPDHIITGEYNLKPNVNYTSNGYNYSTDKIGRIENAKGNLQLGQGKRNSTHQVNAGGKDRNIGDHGGHLIAHVFGGSGLVDNIVPMNGRLVNQGSYRKLEIEWNNALKQGQEVYVDIIPKYKGDTLRPTEFVVNYTIDGKNFRRRLRNP